MKGFIEVTSAHDQTKRLIGLENIAFVEPIDPRMSPGNCRIGLYNLYSDVKVTETYEQVRTFIAAASQE